MKQNTDLMKKLRYSNYKDMCSLLSYLLINNGITIGIKIRANKITLSFEKYANIISKFLLDKYGLPSRCKDENTIFIYLSEETVYLNIYTLARAISVACIAMGINTSKRK